MKLNHDLWKSTLLLYNTIYIPGEDGGKELDTGTIFDPFVLIYL